MPKVRVVGWFSARRDWTVPDVSWFWQDLQYQFMECVVHGVVRLRSASFTEWSVYHPTLSEVLTRGPCHVMCPVRSVRGVRGTGMEVREKVAAVPLSDPGGYYTAP